MSGPEYSPFKYREDENCKDTVTLTNKFKFKPEEVKNRIPIYDSEHLELLLNLVNEYWNMAETYEIFTRDMTLIFDRLRRSLSRQVRTDWDIIVYSKTLEEKKIEDSLTELLKKIIREDAEDNLKDYIERKVKPRFLKYRHWIRKSRYMNIYLNQIVGQANQFTDKKQIQNIIEPIISSIWKGYFKLKEEHQKSSLQHVFRIIETLEKSDSPTKQQWE